MKINLEKNWLTFHGEEGEFEFGGRWRDLLAVASRSTPASRHFSLHRRLSSARKRQLRHVCAALNKSLGSRNDKTCKASCKLIVVIQKKKIQFCFKKLIVPEKYYFKLFYYQATKYKTVQSQWKSQAKLKFFYFVNSEEFKV